MASAALYVCETTYNYFFGSYVLINFGLIDDDLLQGKAVVQHLYLGRNPPMFTEMRVLRESTDDDHLVWVTFSCMWNQ